MIKYHSNKNKCTVYCFSPLNYWQKIQKYVSHLPWKVLYRPNKPSLFINKVRALENLEKKTWSIPNPSFTRTNFGVFGSGIIFIVEIKGKIIGSVNFVGPSLFDKSIHIWNLIIDREFRKQKIASLLITTTLFAIKNRATTITLQTRSNSDALGLYLKLGPNKIIWSQAIDSGNWNSPKIGLEIPVPKNPAILFDQSQKKIPVEFNKTIKVKDNDRVWKIIGNNPNVWGKLYLVGIRYTEKNKFLYLQNNKLIKKILN